MAIAQRQYEGTIARPRANARHSALGAARGVPRSLAALPRPYNEAVSPRPARRPAVDGRPVRSRPQVAWGPLFRPILVAGGLAATLVVYVSGYAQMTHAGYERVHLQNQQRDLQVEQQILRSDLLLHHNREAVEQWAGLHGFTRGSAAPLVVHREAPEGR